MKFSFAAVFAFAAAVLAKPILLNSNYQIEENTPFTLKWSGASGPVTITLMTGSDPNNLKVVSDLVSGESGSEYTFTLKDVPTGTYAIRITDSTGEVNYSPQFQYVGTGTLSSSTVTVSSTTGTHSSTSASASSTTSGSSSSSSSSSAASTTSSASNSSSTLSTSTSSTPSSTRAAATSTTTPINSNDGQRFASPLALVLVTVAALLFFH